MIVEDKCIHQHIFVVSLPFVLPLLSSCTRIHLNHDHAIDAARTFSTTTLPTLTCEGRGVPRQKSRRSPPASRSAMHVPRYDSAASRCQSMLFASV